MANTKKNAEVVTKTTKKEMTTDKLISLLNCCDQLISYYMERIQPLIGMGISSDLRITDTCFEKDNEKLKKYVMLKDKIIIELENRIEDDIKDLV